MTDFLTLLDSPTKLSAALKSVQMSSKERGDLIHLCNFKAGIPTTRDKGNRVRGETVFSCSKVGSYLTLHFDGVGPADKMMWVGFMKPGKDGAELWTMRPQVKVALKAIGWV